MEDVNETPKKEQAQASILKRIVRFTAWEDIKAIISDKLLWYAACLLPEDSHEKLELLQFLLGYHKRSIARRKELDSEI